MATLQELESALVKADQAGNADDARALAGEIRRLRSAPAQPSSVPTVMGSAKDDQRRLAQGGKTYEQQDTIAQGSADDYQSKVDALNRREALGRTMGIGGRAMWRGLAAIPDIVATPLTAGLNWLGDKQDTTSDLITGKDSRYFPRQGNFTESADYLMDKMGAPRPQTPGERIGSETTAALTGAVIPIGAGREMANSGSKLISGIGDMLKASPLVQLMGGAASGASSQTAQELGASPSLQLLAGLGGGLTPAALDTVGSAGLRGLMRGRSGDTVQQNINAFSGTGTMPSAGQAAGPGWVSGLEQLLSGAPTSAGLMNRFAGKQSDEIGQGLGRLADEFTRNASAESAGRAVVKGVRGDNGFIEKTKGTSGRLYDLLDQAMPPDSRVEVGNTTKALSELNAAIPGAPNVSKFFQNGRIQGIESGLADDIGGPQAVLSRPGMREEADALRNKLMGEANERRAGLAQESNKQRQDLIAEAGAKREQLVNQADEKRAALTEEARTIAIENARLASLGLQNHMRRVPTKAEIEAQIPTAKDIEAQVMSMAEIDRRVTPASAYEDPNFGKDYVDKQVDEFLRSKVDNKLPYEALAKLRTLVGKELENSSLVSDVPRSKWKAVYKSLSQDLEQAAATNPEAKRAWSRATKYYDARIERLDMIDHVVEKAGGPEKVFTAALSGTREGATTLRAVMQSLPKEGQQALTGAVIKRMGLANPGAQDAAGEAFSTQTFLTNWNKMSPEARKALFDRHGPAFTKDMDRIAAVADNIRKGGEMFRNPSGSANKIAASSYWGSLAIALGTGNFKTAGAVAGLGLAANKTAKAFTNPMFVHWLAQATEAPVHALPGQLIALQRLLEKQGDEDTAEVVAALSDKVNSDIYGQEGDEGLEVDITGGNRGPAPTPEEMRRLRAGLAQ